MHILYYNYFFFFSKLIDENVLYINASLGIVSRPVRWLTQYISLCNRSSPHSDFAVIGSSIHVFVG